MSEQTIPYKIYLDESQLPTAWYNLRADMWQTGTPIHSICCSTRRRTNR